MTDSFENNNMYTHALPFQNESYLNGNDFYQSDLQPRSPTCDPFKATPRFVTQDKKVATNSTTLFADSFLEEASPTSEFSGIHVSVFPLRSDDSYDQKDSSNASRSSPLTNHMVNLHETPPSPTMTQQQQTVPDSNHSGNSSESPSWETKTRLSSSQCNRKGSSSNAHRLSHNKIEKRYRSNLNEQIRKLWRKVDTERKTNLKQPTKSAVLTAAMDYIFGLEVEMEETRKRCKLYEELFNNQFEDERSEGYPRGDSTIQRVAGSATCWSTNVQGEGSRMG